MKTLRFEALENRSMMAAYRYADKELSHLIATNYADKVISRTEAIEVFASIADKGKVDAKEIADIRQFVKLNMPEDVKYFSKSMLSNPANRTVSPLANGSTAANVFKLIDKWFLGKDRPVAATQTTYKPVSGNLFVDGVSTDDARQGRVGDCYFVAALAALAAKNQTSVQQMFKDNNDSTWTVTFYAQEYKSIRKGLVRDFQLVYTKEFVTVDKYLPVDQSGNLYGANYGDSSTNPNNELWVALAEKAFAQWSETGHSRMVADQKTNSYENIGRGGWSRVAFEAVSGQSCPDYGRLNETILQKALSENKPLVIYKELSVTRVNGAGVQYQAILLHALVVESYSASTRSYELYNPWGSRLTMNSSELNSCSGYAICNKTG